MKALIICGDAITDALMQNSSKASRQRVCKRTPPNLRSCTVRHLLLLLIKSLLDAWRSLPIPTTRKILMLQPQQVPFNSSLGFNKPSTIQHRCFRHAQRQPFLSKHGTDLQAALDKHRDDVLHLLRMGTTAGQNIIPKKMLTKVLKANMTTMTQVNTLIARAGGKELSTWRLKELGSIAKHKAMKLYGAKVAK
jgi:hypothetical protein